MAGTFPNVCGGQQIDRNGRPLAGCILTVFDGGTTTLSSVFQDIGLAIPGQNPMTADITGRLPFFFVDDGVYRVQLTDAEGVAIFDIPQLPSIGASSSGGGGTSVDPTTIFQTGDPIWLPIEGTRTGWVRMNARTIGSASSGASERANADCQALFLYLWSNYNDTECPVVGGRGGTGLIDWNANKQITLPDLRGRAPFGVTGMGNTDSGRIPQDGDIFSSGAPDAAASVGGEAKHLLLHAELPSADLPVSGNQKTRGVFNHDLTTGPTTFSMPNPGLDDLALSGVTAALGGSNTPHNNMPPFMVGTFYMKL